MPRRIAPESSESNDPGANWSADPLASWLAKPDRNSLDPIRLLTGLCERLLDAGVPLWRVSIGVTTLHPQVRGRQFIWWRDSAEVTQTQYRHGVEKSSEYLESPVEALHRGSAAVRIRLDGVAPQLDFQIIRDIAERGGSDYAAMPLRFSSGRQGYVSWVTDRPGGFDANELSRLQELLPLIALRWELEASHFISRSLLATYLGQDAAQRVLTGQIRRGEGKRIHAAILLSDLRGFTALSDRLPTDEVIALLNDYFDTVVTQVEKHGGEVLKFIGDGLLAVFNVDGSKRDSACCQAIHAAIATMRNLAELNRNRIEPFEVGIALHLGDVVYGNIGAADRLDFTVIGPAVNEAARIEKLCKSLGKPILTSASFALSCTCKPLISLGLRSLDGLAEQQELFTVQEP